MGNSVKNPEIGEVYISIPDTPMTVIKSGPKIIQFEAFNKWSGKYYRFNLKRKVFEYFIEIGEYIKGADKK